MTDRLVQGGYVPMPTSPVILISGRNAVGGGMRVANMGSPSSGGNPFAANEMLAFPFVLTAPITNVNKGFVLNGSSTGANFSLAIYDADFNMINQTGSTAQSGASVPQSVSLATRLRPGLYYVAMAASDATTGRWFRWSQATVGNHWMKALGCWKQASITVGSLPATATPEALTNIAFPVFGLITRTVFDV